MKRIIIFIIAVILSGASSFAQTFELGFKAGTSLNLSCLADAGVDVAMVFPTAGGFDLGIGSGLLFSVPLDRKTATKTNSSKEQISREYSTDFTLPLFARFRFRFQSNFFLQADAGYRFGLVSLYYGEGRDFGAIPANAKESTFRGLFFEPQAGFHVSERGTLSFGMTWQRYKRGDAHRSVSTDEVFYSYNTVPDWCPLVFVRYCISL